MSRTIELRNPHSVLACLQHRPEDVLEVSLAGSEKDSWQEVGELARQLGIRVQHRTASSGRRNPKRQTSRTSKLDQGRTASSSAMVRPRQPADPSKLFANPASPGLWLGLERIQDPHNIGAIVRTAAFFGLNGVLLTEQQSAPLSGTVYDVASGGMEHVQFAVVPNLGGALDRAKQADVWILGTSERAETTIDQVKLDRRWMLVLGNEQRGLRAMTTKKCDQTCSIASRGRIHSLNVSVAAGVAIALLTGAKERKSSG